MYVSRTPTYEIDLALPEEERWSDVIAHELRAAMKITKQARADITSWLPGPLGAVAGGIFKKAYDLSGGRFSGEIEAWAEALDMSPGLVTMLNCSYELSQIGAASPFACTAGVQWVNSLGMVHVRTLDWPLSAIGDATRLFRFRKGRHQFVVVGIVGFVGALSGMVPGSYSLTINWAPPSGRPKFNFGPAFLLREVFEDCPSYDEAVYSLSRTAVSSPVFFTVCGAKKGQACVIERTHTKYAIREMDDGPLVQGNHHVAQKFAANNQNEELLEYSTERAEALHDALTKLSDRATLESAAACLDVEPVLNGDTYQQMVFQPKAGEVRVWRWVKDKPRSRA